MSFKHTTLVLASSKNRNAASDTPVNYTLDLSIDVDREIRSIEVECVSVLNVQNNIRAGFDTLTFKSADNLTTTSITLQAGYYTRSQVSDLIVAALEAEVPASAPASCVFEQQGEMFYIALSVNPASVSTLSRIIGGSGLAERLGFMSSSINNIGGVFQF